MQPPDRKSNPVPSIYATVAATIQFYDECLRHNVPCTYNSPRSDNEGFGGLLVDSSDTEGILLCGLSSSLRQFTEHCYTMLKIRSTWRMVCHNMQQTKLITTENPFNSTFANDATMLGVPWDCVQTVIPYSENSEVGLKEDYRKQFSLTVVGNSVDMHSALLQVFLKE